MQWIDLPVSSAGLSVRHTRRLKIEQGRKKARGAPRLGGFGLHLSICPVCTCCSNAENERERIDFSGSWKEAGAAGSGSVFATDSEVTNKICRRSLCMHVWRRMHTVDISHSWCKMTLHTQHTPPPAYRPTSSITACAIALLQEHWPTYSAYGWEKGSTAPQELKTAAVEIGCCTDKRQQGGFYYFHCTLKAFSEPERFFRRCIGKNEKFPVKKSEPSPGWTPGRLCEQLAVTLRETGAH